MLTITSSLIEANVEILRRHNYVVVQHLKNDTVDFVGGLHKAGCRISNVIGISYSVDRSAVQRLSWGEIRAEVKEFSQISSRLGEIILASSEAITLLDVGGYGSAIAANQSFSERLNFIVEDTNNGLWRYQSIAPHCPVMDVASIENKSVENAYAGRRIVDGVFKFFSDSGISLPTQDYIVVGFGGIGQNVCSALAFRGINAAVIELDERKLAVAEARGHRIARSISNFPTAKVVIGCTGTASVTLEELKTLSECPFLVSGSSKRVEFQDILAKGILSPVRLHNAVTEKVTGARIVNDGQPINLYYGSLNDETSDFMFANITAAIIEGSDKRGGAIFRLSDKWQREVCRLWFERYLA